MIARISRTSMGAASGTGNDDDKGVEAEELDCYIHTYGNKLKS
jgi:hypothetical protein